MRSRDLLLRQTLGSGTWANEACPPVPAGLMHQRVPGTRRDVTDSAPTAPRPEPEVPAPAAPFLEQCPPASATLRWRGRILHCSAGSWCGLALPSPGRRRRAPVRLSDALRCVRERKCLVCRNSQCPEQNSLHLAWRAVCAVWRSVEWLPGKHGRQCFGDGQLSPSLTAVVCTSGFGRSACSRESRSAASDWNLG